MPAFTGAGAAAAVALTWPLGDLAAHWSLTTLVIQRLILTLAVASLVLVLVGMRGDRRRGRAVHRDGGGLDGHSRGGGRSLVAGRAGVDGSGGSGGRPLYSTFVHSHLAVGLRPLNDQEISGFVSKLTMLFVLFSVGAVVLNQALRVDEEYGEDEPLVWADVERQLERAARRSERNAKHDRDPTSPPPDDTDQ